ncbi:MAG TPA: hypothetical protein VI072_24525 [Polyangiaceae bacterium]
MNKYVVGIILAVPFGLACGPAPAPGGTAGTGGAPPANPFCNVKSVLTAKCTGCHYPGSGQAPMSLTTYADTQAIRNGKPVWQLMAERVGGGTMPPIGSSQAAGTTQADRDVIRNWNGSGSECSGPVTSCADGEMCNLRNCNGEACISNKCNITHRFLAHSGNGSGRWPVAANTLDDYRCFTFANPFYNTNIQVTAETPIIDAGNPSVIHHWLLFGSSRPPSAAGGPPSGGTGIFQCVSPELGDKLISGWAPGGDAYILPPDIGLTLRSYPYLVLQSHYFTTPFVSGSDKSGVAFCTTPTARTNAATIVTLGTDNISIPAGAQGAKATGYCDSRVGGNGLAKNNRPVYVIGSSPHMHTLGTAFTTTHTRGTTKLANFSTVGPGGEVERWTFDQQHKYGLPRVPVQPGDSLVTTCTYSNPGPFPVGFGPGTSAEMCYDFIMAYPAADTRGECGQGVTFNNQ